ncbi:transglycosylase SLT domain-containing protein (plasmid) [Burkholderia vietnamiensis]|uniref:Lytic transglycosylase, catalytic n=1 Tax=Burkholderia vietnamiensis (strain G4 / LMG 22486) TaxID=269482 RepID=A4JWG2_BURVG|nr:Lytic transglycosylase, catalytic [Burkholderia vietnamiensis G4]MCB4349790.1 transglycosylase SLT domain-containing protein [Burkholderia vietnamiensis]
MIKADSQGFLIADKALDHSDLTSGLNGIRSDTGAILALLQHGAKTGLLRRQKVPNPNSGASSLQAASPRARANARNTSGAPSTASVPLPRVNASTAAWDRARDERGRFVARAPATESVMPMRAPTLAPDAASPASTDGRAPRRPRAAQPAPSTDLTPVTQAVNSLTRAQAAQAAQAARESRAQASAKNQGKDEAAAARAANQTRDARGRFGSGGASDGGDSRSLFSKLKGLFSRPSAPDMGDFDKVDPTIEAAHEMGKMLGGPLGTLGNLGRSIAGRFGGKDGAIPWYRRIFTELRLTRRQHSDFGIAEQRTLKEIERKTGVAEGGGKGGLFGLLGGGMSKLLGGMGGGIMRLFVGGGGLLKLLGRGALGLGKLGLRRLPLLGALFAGGSALASMFGPGDPNKSDEENRKDRFTGAGSGIGALLGGGIGMLLGGPVGAVVGGVLGDKVGELVGAWLATVDWSKVADTITGAWKSTVGFFKDSWKTVTDKLGEISKTVSDAWKSIVDGAKAFLKDKFGIDVDAIVQKGKEVAGAAVDQAKKAAEPVVNVAKTGAEKAKEIGKAAVDYGKERVEKMAAPIARAGGAVMDWGEGIYSKLNKGYRRKQSFDGVKGGDALAKYGTYTDDEAAKIKELKASGANTSANLPGGMQPEIRDKIITASQKNGLDPKTMLEFAAMESGGNANAISSTGAVGIFQFTGSTASGVGIKDRFNADQNIQGGMQLANANAAQLTKAGLPVTAANLYMMHQLGPGAAKEIIQGAKDGKNISQLSGNTQKAVSLNYGKGSTTAAEYLAKNSAALEARGKSVVGDMSNLSVPATALASAKPADKATAVASNAPTKPVAPASPSPSPSPATSVQPGVPPALASTTVAVAASPAPVVPPPVVTAAAPPSPPRVSIAAASVPAPSNVPPAAQASIPVPMNSAGPMEVHVSNDQPVGQDLRDRRLSMIATGGIAA